MFPRLLLALLLSRCGPSGAWRHIAGSLGKAQLSHDGAGKDTPSRPLKFPSLRSLFAKEDGSLRDSVEREQVIDALLAQITDFDAVKKALRPHIEELVAESSGSHGGPVNQEAGQKILLQMQGTVRVLMEDQVKKILSGEEQAFGLLSGEGETIGGEVFTSKLLKGIPESALTMYTDVFSIPYGRTSFKDHIYGPLAKALAFWATVRLEEIMGASRTTERCEAIRSESFQLNYELQKGFNAAASSQDASVLKDAHTSVEDLFCCGGRPCATTVKTDRVIGGFKYIGSPLRLIESSLTAVLDEEKGKPESEVGQILNKEVMSKEEVHKIWKTVGEQVYEKLQTSAEGNFATPKQAFDWLKGGAEKIDARLFFAKAFGPLYMQSASAVKSMPFNLFGSMASSYYYISSRYGYPIGESYFVEKMYPSLKTLLNKNTSDTEAFNTLKEVFEEIEASVRRARGHDDCVYLLAA